MIATLQAIFAANVEILALLALILYVLALLGFRLTG